MRRLTLLIACVTLTSSLGADSRFRADDGTIWHLTDNPALPAATDTFSLGASISPSSASNDRWSQGSREFALNTSLLSLSYLDAPSGRIIRYGASLRFDEVSLGYRADVAGAATHNFGLLWRPVDLLSSALTLDDAAGTRVWGAGLALRPLTLWQPGADWLTLTGDFAWGLAPEQRWGAKLAWGGADVRAWYDFETRVPGVEVTLNWGASETTASAHRIGQALKFSPSTPLATPVILRVRVPRLGAPLPTSPFLPEVTSLSSLVNKLDRAAANPLVVAVVFENPPSTGGLAGAEELRAAAGRLKAAGKRVYVHADNFEDGTGFQGWIASADRVSLDPLGVLMLTAGASKRLYLKEFFDKIGVRFINLAPWETKSVNNPLTYSSMPDGERAMLQRFLTDRDSLAANALADGRGGLLKRSAQTLVADGPYLSPREALDAGLVDKLESRSAFEEAVGKLHPQTSFVDTLPEPVPSWGAAASRTVVVVHLSGDILPGNGQAGSTIGADAADVIAKLRNDFGVKALLLRVDSPGGAVQPSDALAEEIKKTVAAGKPVAVAMGNVAASGGYYISAPASRIFAEPGTITGSIGVTAALFTAPKTLELLGIKPDGVELAPSAAVFDWTKPPTDAMLKKWNSMILATYDRFLDVVAEGRHLDKETLEPLARGQVYTGNEALDLGLVDELGGEYEARRWLENELGGPAEFVDVIPGESSLLGRLVGPLATAAVQASDSPTLKLAQALDRLSAPWAEAVAGLAARGGGPLVWCEVP